MNLLWSDLEQKLHIITINAIIIIIIITVNPIIIKSLKIL